MTNVRENTTHQSVISLLLLGIKYIKLILPIYYNDKRTLVYNISTSGLKKVILNILNARVILM